MIDQIGAEVHQENLITSNVIMDQTRISKCPIVVMKVADGLTIEINKTSHPSVSAMMRGGPSEISTILHSLVVIMAVDGPTIVITKGIHPSVDAMKKGVVIMVVDGPTLEVNKAIHPLVDVMIRLSPGEITVLHPMLEMTTVLPNTVGIIKDILSLLNRTGMTTAVMLDPEDTAMMIGEVLIRGVTRNEFIYF